MDKNLNTKIIRLSILIILLLIILSCATNIINYDRTKIVKKQNSKYSVYLNNNKIDINNVYLDKNNINKVEINRKKKIITINQKDKSKLIKLKKINFNKLINDTVYWKENNSPLVIINGLPLFDSIAEKTKIEISSIKSVKYIPTNEISKEAIFCNPPNKVLIIITK